MVCVFRTHELQGAQMFLKPAIIATFGALVLAACGHRDGHKHGDGGHHSHGAEDTVSQAIEVNEDEFGLMGMKVDGNIRVRAGLLRQNNSTRAGIIAHGLKPGVEYPVHLHVDTCANATSKHYMHIAGNPNPGVSEIHLTAKANEGRNLARGVRVPWVARPEAKSIVLHDGTKRVCVDLK